MFQYCLFDFDGTLADSGEGIMKSVQYALHKFGIEENDFQKLALFVGPPLKESFTELYGFTPEEAEQGVETYRERYNVTCVEETKIYPGVTEMLEKLQKKQVHLAVASSKPEYFIHRILKHYDAEKYFEVIVGSELNGNRIRKEEVVEEALRQLGVLTIPVGKRKACCAMIGDRKFDIQGAKAHGLTAVGAQFDYTPEGELEAAGAEFIAKTVEELSEFLEND